MNPFSHLAAGAALFCALSIPAHAAFVAYHADDSTTSIKLDGKLSDPVWGKAEVFDTFYENLPKDRIAAKVRTEIKVVYDSRYFYVGMKAFDPNPDQIRAPFSRRDKTLGDQDVLILLIDPLGSRKSAQFIRVNPRGSVSDGSFSDVAGEDFAPDFDFDVATGRFDGGWTAEVRIPFSSLAYAPGSNAPWNMLVLRSMMREQRYRLVNAPMPSNASCFLCFAEPVTNLHDLPAGASWSATPQLLMRAASERANGRPAVRSNSHALSLDVKVRPTPDLAIDATINPDFSQVELDAPQLSGNTKFGLFFDEKRPFFLEGADTLGTPQRVISTRSINDPAWGARVTRRNSGSDLTLLSVLDNGGALVQLPGAYSTAFAAQDFRSRATVGRANLRFNDLALGAVATDRTLEGGRGYNRVLGPDFSWQINDSVRLDGQYLSSDTTALADASGRLVAQSARHGHAAIANFNGESENWEWVSAITDVSPDFRADNGFFSQVGFRDTSIKLRRKLGQVGVMHLFNLYAFGERQDDSDGNTIFHGAGAGVYMNGPRNSLLNLKLLPGERVRVKQGGELLTRSHVVFESQITPGPVLANLSANLDLGDVIDVDASRVGRGGTASVSGKVRPNDRIDIEPSYTLSFINDKAAGGARLYTERLFALNGIVHFGANDNLRVILQDGSTVRADGLAATDTRYRTTSLVYSHSRGIGSALYIGLTLSNNQQLAARQGLRQNELFVKGSWRL